MAQPGSKRSKTMTTSLATSSTAAASSASAASSLFGPQPIPSSDSANAFEACGQHRTVYIYRDNTSTYHHYVAVFLGESRPSVSTSRFIVENASLGVVWDYIITNIAIQTTASGGPPFVRCSIKLGPGCFLTDRPLRILTRMHVAGSGKDTIVGVQRSGMTVLHGPIFVVQRETSEPYQSDQFFTRLSDLSICPPSNHPPVYSPATFGVSVSDSASFHMDNVSIGCIGMEITRSYSIKLRDCEFRSTEGTAVHVTSCNAAHRGGLISILDCHFVENNIGVHVENSDQIIIRGNAFSKTSAEAVKVVGTESECIDVAVENNTITDTGADAVHLQGVNKFAVGANRVSKCDGHGVKVASGSFGTIHDNLLANTNFTLGAGAAIELDNCEVAVAHNNVIGNDLGSPLLTMGIRAITGNAISATGNAIVNVPMASEIVITTPIQVVSDTLIQPGAPAGVPALPGTQPLDVYPPLCDAPQLPTCSN